LSGAESVLKKKRIIQDLRSDSATPIGSSGGAGFPEIDTNSVAQEWVNNLLQSC
jgi:hypothetical protein